MDAAERKEQQVRGPSARVCHINAGLDFEKSRKCSGHRAASRNQLDYNDYNAESFVVALLAKWLRRRTCNAKITRSNRV